MTPLTMPRLYRQIRLAGYDSSLLQIKTRRTTNQETEKIMSRSHLKNWAVTAALTASILGATLGAFGQQARTVLEKRSTGVEVVAKLNLEPDNLAVTPNGLLVFGVRTTSDKQARVAQVSLDGTVSPFPNSKWAGPPREDGTGMTSVVAIKATPDGLVWMFDRGSEQAPAKIVAWDTINNKLAKSFVFPVQARKRPPKFMHDIAVDGRNKLIYMAGTQTEDSKTEGQPVLVVIDIRKQEIRLLPLNRPNFSVAATFDEARTRQASSSKKVFEVGLNVPIGIDPDNQWVYFGYLASKTLWRVKADDLANINLSPDEVAAKVEKYGDKPIGNGIAPTESGVVYLSDELSNAIGAFDKVRNYRMIAKDEILNVPNGLCVAPDGYVYVCVNRPMRDTTYVKDQNEMRFIIARVKQLQR